MNVIQFPKQLRVRASAVAARGSAADRRERQPTDDLKKIENFRWAWRDATARVDFFDRLRSIRFAARHAFKNDAKGAADYREFIPADDDDLIEGDRLIADELAKARSALLLTPVATRAHQQEKLRLITRWGRSLDVDKIKLSAALKRDEAYLATPVSLRRNRRKDR